MIIAFVDGDPFLSASAWGQLDPTTHRRIPPSFEQASNRLHSSINNTIGNLFVDHHIIAFGGSSNWRLDVYPGYKNSPSRVKSRQSRPDYWGDLKQSAYDRDDVVVTEGFEADDIIGIWAHQAIEAGDDYIIVSIDKDLDTIPGKHYNPDKKIVYEVSELESVRFFYKQMIMGDGVDNVPGIPRMGPVAASNMLDHVDSAAEMREVVIDAYINKFGTDWHSWYLSNMRMLHIWRSSEDSPTIY